MENLFIKAKPIWAEGRFENMNETLCFTERFGGVKEAELRITARDFYRVFLNGELLGFGPARAAKGYCRVDVYLLKNLKTENVIFIEVNAYNCSTLYVCRESPFVRYEIISGGKPIVATGESTECREFSARIKNVMRFSYQRAFTEYYEYSASTYDVYSGGYDGFPKLKTASATNAVCLPRGLKLPNYTEEQTALTEGGNFTPAERYLLCRDRYMFNEDIGIFKLQDLRENVNDLLCSLSYVKTQAKQCIEEGSYALYKTEGIRTGFIAAEFTAETDSELIIVFEETDLRENVDEDSPINLCFYRNTTQNYLRLAVKKGIQRFISFEPYAAQYIKILAIKGSINISRVYIIKYENGDCGGFLPCIGDTRLDAVISAALETFRQNSLDLLTDCPSRERAGWLCDSYFCARAEKFFTGKNDVERNFLENYALASQNPRFPEGMIDMCYPSDNSSYIENWALWYIIELEDYFVRTGDTVIVKQSEDKVKGLLKYFSGLENEYGLLENSTGWIFVEWSKANDKEFTRGVNFPSNMLYAAALEAADALYGGGYAAKAVRLREEIRHLSFNGEFFEDNCVRENGELVRKGHISETCQYYAFYFGVADKKNYPDLYKTLFDAFGPNGKAYKKYPKICKSNMFIGYYLRLDYLLREKRYRQILDECVGYFYGMAKKTGTLWEHSSPEASLCHGFSSYIGKIICDCAGALGLI